MRILLSLLLINVMLAVSGSPTTELATGSAFGSNADSIPTRTVQETADGIIVTYKFTSPSISEDNLFPGIYQCVIPGFSVITQSGKPAVSEHIDAFVAPVGSNPYVTLLSASHHDLDYTLAPARFPISETDTIGHTADNVAPIAPYSGYYPESVCTQLTSGDYRNQPIVRIKISPVQYDYDRKSIRAYSELSYKIAFAGNKTPSDIVYEPNSLLNPNCERASTGSTRSLANSSMVVNAGYLIITVPDFEYALRDFIKWKKQLGYNVIVKSQSSWTPDQIKAVVKSTHLQTPSLMYLLIVGDHSKVPGEEKIYKDSYRSEKRYITDFHYGCFGDSTDFIPDLYRGRIPVRDTNSLETVVDKILWYEQYPPTDPYFYSNASHFAYFEDEEKYQVLNGGPDGTEDRRFVKTCEEVKEYIMSHHNISVERLYQAQIYGYPHPQRWNPIYSNGDSIPAELRFENWFQWGANQNSLISSFNDGRLYILYRGHGFPGGWELGHRDAYTTKPFGLSCINELNNYELMPLVFSITCHSGNHSEDDCFARSMLTKKNGGSMGLFAQTETTYSGYNDKLVSLMFNAIWPEPGFELEKYPISNYIHDPCVMQTVPIYRLGGILDFAINGFDADVEDICDTDLYTKRVTHCFGDPSMLFTTETPTAFNGVEIERGENSINVSLNENAYISFYDSTINRPFMYYGSTASYKFTNPDVEKYVSVVVHNHNKIPMVDSGIEFTGTIAPTAPSQIVGWRDTKAGGRVEIDYIINDADKTKNISMLIVDMATGNFIAEQQVDKSITNQKQTISMYTGSGVLTASLMVNGYPVSNVKMYIPN